jgi:hypothetical protein
MRKNLNDPKQVNDLLPSFLGRLFRQAMNNADDFNYDALLTASHKHRLEVWQSCRTAMGMHYAPENDNSIGRHQYFDLTQIEA